MNPTLITCRALGLTLVFATLCLPSAIASAAELSVPKPDGRAADMSKPVKGFILLGQTNMVGLGRISADGKGGPDGSLEHAVKTQMKYPCLVDGAGG